MMFRFIFFLLILLGFRLLLFYLFPPKNETLPKNVLRETSVFSNIKENTRHEYLKYLTIEQADLLMGIVFGEDVSQKAKKKFIVTGVMHVVAASGMNVSMLAAVCLAVLATFLRRQYALIVTIFTIIFYSGLADFQPSIVRAAIMAIFALGAQVLGRQNTSIYALLLAAFVMIFFDPTIITSVSFLLSFFATLGIIIFDPVLNSGFFKSSVFDDFRTTTAAQIATTPLLFYFFGTYSAISILVNLLVLWTIPPLMLLGMFAAVFGFILPYVSSLFIYLAGPLLAYFIFVVEKMSYAPGSIELKIPIATTIGYYLLLASFFLWRLRGNEK